MAREPKNVETDEEEESKVTEIPSTRDEDGYLLKLGKKDFPTNAEGRCAYIDYQIEKLNEKKQMILDMKDPKKKKVRKLERLQQMLAKLEAEIAADEEDE